MKLAIVIGTKERGARVLDQIVKGPLPYSEAVKFIKCGDHRGTDWERLAICVLTPERKYDVGSLNQAKEAAEAAEAARDAEEPEVADVKSPAKQKTSSKNASKV